MIKHKAPSVYIAFIRFRIFCHTQLPTMNETHSSNLPHGIIGIRTSKAIIASPVHPAPVRVMIAGGSLFAGVA
jgi:hypothetical protein